VEPRHVTFFFIDIIVLHAHATQQLRHTLDVAQDRPEHVATFRLRRLSGEMNALVTQWFNVALSTPIVAMIFD
jgi:hypothetical protein